jgi:predicted nucleotidyltransferase component of viral defense system
MAEERLKIWEILFGRALALIDSLSRAGVSPEHWTLGGGTVLMLRHRHRLSKDVDLFVPDPQYLAYLTPRFNDDAEALTNDYVEQANSLKLIFPEGEIDFVASAPLTANPSASEELLGRQVQVETSAEIVAKKVWHRGAIFTARDIFDLATVAEKEPDALWTIAPILRDRRVALLERIASQEAALREAFAELEILDYQRSFDECVTLVKQALDLPRTRRA